MNTVQVDDAALAAEADAAVANGPVASLVETAVQSEPQTEPGALDAEKAGQVGALIVGQVFDRAAPNWRVNIEEKKRIGGALGEVVLLWFPDGVIPPKYLAIFMLGYTVYEVIDSRRDPVTGKLPPARLPPPKPAQPNAQPVG